MHRASRPHLLFRSNCVIHRPRLNGVRCLLERLLLLVRMNLLRGRHIACLVLNLAAAALMLCVANAAAADATLNAALEWTQIYKPDAWQPLRMQCRNDSASA